MDVVPTELPWLTDPPADFQEQIRSLSGCTPEARTLACQLAGFRLRGSGLFRLGNAINKISADDVHATRLGVLSNGTADLLLPAFSASALRHHLWLHTIGADFDQVAQEALNSASRINQSRCHFVLLCIDHRGLPLAPAPGDPQRAEACLYSALNYIDSLRGALRSASGCTVIVQTVPQVADALFGGFERNLPGTLQWLIDLYNREIRSRVIGSPDLLLDTAALAETVGLAHWHDAVQWTLGKFPFSHSMVPIYADWVGRLIAAARGHSRKCLVLDLDNTLWGGTIGDDGLEGIVLGKSNPAGEAYINIQQTTLALRDRGIVLAVSSKNDDHVARSPFRLHPEMLLKEEHISVFQANWQDKSSNLTAIAQALNIGLDAMVLLDDNPAERAQVRQALPDVAVPELPSDPALYVGTLMAAGYFEAIGFTAEDRQRADQYRANAARAELLGAATDLDTYLRSLEMRAICSPFDRVGRTRITQLINKTNQFNLTTRRYTELEVEMFEKSTKGLTLQVRLLDRFGDNGMVAVVICTEIQSDWVIDTWLMSCRVLNRQLEQTTLNYLVSRARAAGMHSIIGEYLKTQRNDIVRDHYSRLGFVPLDCAAGGSRWQLEVASYIDEKVPIEIVESAASR